MRAAGAGWRGVGGIGMAAQSMAAPGVHLSPTPFDVVDKHQKLLKGFSRTRKTSAIATPRRRGKSLTFQLNGIDS